MGQEILYTEDKESDLTIVTEDPEIIIGVETQLLPLSSHHPSVIIWWRVLIFPYARDKICTLFVF